MFICQLPHGFCIRWLSYLSWKHKQDKINLICIYNCGLIAKTCRFSINDWLDVYIIYTFEFFDCKFKINILFSPPIILMFLRPYQNPLDRYYWSFNTVSPQNRHALFRKVTILVTLFRFGIILTSAKTHVGTQTVKQIRSELFAVFTPINESYNILYCIYSCFMYKYVNISNVNCKFGLKPCSSAI